MGYPLYFRIQTLANGNVCFDCKKTRQVILTIQEETKKEDNCNLWSEIKASQNIETTEFVSC